MFSLTRLIVFLLTMLAFSFEAAADSALTSENNCTINTTKCFKVAVCYWGLTRSTKKVYESHYTNLFNVLESNQIPYDVFIHTWETKSKQRVWTTEIERPIDYDEYKLLNPTYFKRDDQDVFTENLDFSKYYYQHVSGNDEWLPKLILNHLCALESEKRVTDMVIDTGNEYDVIIYVRPDAQLFDKLPIEEVLNVKDGDILIPNFAHFEGYNDRFAVLSLKTAPIYGKRIDGIAEFRKTQGRIVAEKYVKYICDINHLNVRFINFNFELIRP